MPSFLEHERCLGSIMHANRPVKCYYPNQKVDLARFVLHFQLFNRRKTSSVQNDGGHLTGAAGRTRS